MICINSITICPENITITKGKWYYGAYAEICPTNATCKCLTWHSSNSNVASVTENGYICGVSEGVAVIYATAQDGSGAVGFCNVTVVAPVKVSSVTVSPSTKMANAGDTFGLLATVCPNNAEDKRVRWTSCDCSIADVDYLTGCVTAKKAGTTCICANAIDGSGVSGCCEVAVQNVLISKVTINPVNKIMAVGSATTLTATVLPANANNKTIVWSSSDENIATVIPSTGYVMAKNPGTTNIWAFSQDGSNQYMNCTITVNGLPDIDNDSWEEMGFKYDGSQRDFVRLNQGLPPYSYEQWILNGRQKAVYISDKSKLPIVGHAVLLIRSTEGVWYKTQFAGPWLDKSEAKVYCEKISESDKESLLNKAGVDYVYLYGDYRESLRKAQEIEADENNNYNGKYDLLGNNCLHYVNEILGYGINIDSRINSFIATNLSCEPQVYYGCLVSIINGEDLLDTE